MNDITNRPVTKSRRGFALVVVVSLLAFLVLVLLALTSLTRVELAVADTTTQVTSARQNAMVALHVALGRLQETAAYDRSVTGQGDLVPVARAINPYWTGVWDTTSGEPGAVPVWLVSGGTSSPSVNWFGNAEAVQLVGARAAAPAATRHVHVPIEPLTTDGWPGLAGTRRIGGMAYWVGDEGVKGHLGLVDRTRETADNVLNAGEGPIPDARARERVGRLLAARGGPDAVSGLALGEEGADIARWSHLPRVLMPGQLEMTLATNTTHITTLRQGFHTFTTSSRGLLTNPRTGGLKVNYSYADIPGRGFVRDLQQAVVTPSANPVMAVAQSQVPDLNEPAANIRPVITEIALDIVPFREDSPGGAAEVPVRIGYRLRMEFWNPYPVSMTHVADIGADDYRVRVSGLPILTFRAPLQPVQPDPVQFHLADLITPTTDMVIDLQTSLAPGALERRSQSIVFRGDTALAVTPVTVFDATPGSGGNPLDDRLEYSWLGGSLRFEVYRNVPGGEPLLVVDGVPFEAGVRYATGNWYVAGNNAFPGTAFTSTTELVNRGITFHAAIDESLVGSLRDWINPEPPAVVGYPPDLRGRRVDWSTAFFESVGGDPAANAQSTAGIFPLSGFFQRNSRIVVADVPAQAQLSLGHLQFVSFPGARPFAAGNPWGGPVNQWFDDGFLLPVSGDWRRGQTLPNPRMYALTSAQHAADLAQADAARHLLVEGAFNVNSTSAEAWTALLGRATRVTTANESNLANTTVENPVFYFPNAADLISTTAVPSAENRGLRGLSDQQVRDLATRIAVGIRDRGQPFVTMEEFLNSGVVAAAIAGNMTAPQTAVRVNQGVTPYSPSYLTQAVLLSAVQPFLTVRSDTFVIRTYGEVRNPVTEEVTGRAWAEALVQRIPEKLDGSDPMTDTAPGSFGRRFVITSFRWLGPEDL
jgi:hypothetical protein